MKKERLGPTAAIIGFAILFVCTVSAWGSVARRLDRMESRIDEQDETANVILDQLCQVANPDAQPQLASEDPCEARAYIRALVDSALVSEGLGRIVPQVLEHP